MARDSRCRTGSGERRVAKLTPTIDNSECSAHSEPNHGREHAQELSRMNSDEWERINALQASGATIKGISWRTGFSRNTIRRALQLTTAHDDRRVARSPLYESNNDDIKPLLSTPPRPTAPANR